MSSGTNSERIIENNGIISNNNATIDNFKTTIENLPDRAITQSKSVTITENGTTNVAPDSGYDGLSGVAITTNVSGTDLNDYFGATISNGYSSTSGLNKIIKKIPSISITGTSAQYLFVSCSGLVEVPLFDTSNITNMNYMFQGCTSLHSIPQYNTSNVTTMIQMFSSCTNLTTIPELNTSSLVDANSMKNMFQSCNSLSDETIYNILNMCIKATNYTGTKTLNFLGFGYNQRAQAQRQSNWNDFVNAGWSA